VGLLLTRHLARLSPATLPAGAFQLTKPVVPRSKGGGRTLDNGLLKHCRCNLQRADAPPTGCDLVWLEGVKAGFRKLSPHPPLQSLSLYKYVIGFAGMIDPYTNIYIEIHYIHFNY